MFNNWLFISYLEVIVLPLDKCPRVQSVKQNVKKKTRQKMYQVIISGLLDV